MEISGLERDDMLREWMIRIVFRIRDFGDVR